MSENYSKFYKEVYGQDFPTDGITHGWIQWKGTQPCMDIHCVCGYHDHVDADYFFYAYECPNCHQKYAVGQNIKLIPLNAEQVEEMGHDFISGDRQEQVEEWRKEQGGQLQNLTEDKAKS